MLADCLKGHSTRGSDVLALKASSECQKMAVENCDADIFFSAMATYCCFQCTYTVNDGKDIWPIEMCTT